MENINYFGITLDLWTNQYTHVSFLAITNHFITEDSLNSKLKINNYIIKNIEMKENKSGVKIKKVLEQELTQMNCFKKDNVYVTDNGTNVTKAVEDFNSISCSGHNINLILKHSVESNETLKYYKETIKSIVKSLKKISF